MEAIVDLYESEDLYKKVYKEIRIKTTNGTTLLGKVIIGERQKLSALFTKSADPFISLVDVEGSDISAKVLFLNKNNILWVEADDHPRKTNILGNNAPLVSNSEGKRKTTRDTPKECCEDLDMEEPDSSTIRETSEPSVIREKGRAS
jgi:hypothetical protein